MDGYGLNRDSRAHGDTNMHRCDSQLASAIPQILHASRTCINERNFLLRDVISEFFFPGSHGIGEEFRREEMIANIPGVKSEAAVR